MVGQRILVPYVRVQLLPSQPITTAELELSFYGFSNIIRFFWEAVFSKNI